MRVLPASTPLVSTATRGWVSNYGRFCRSLLWHLLKHIKGYLVRWARKDYRRPESFKRVKT